MLEVLGIAAIVVGAALMGCMAFLGLLAAGMSR